MQVLYKQTQPFFVIKFKKTTKDISLFNCLYSGSLFTTVFVAALPTAKLSQRKSLQACKYFFPACIRTSDS